MIIPQVGIAAQLPSGTASSEDFDYTSFWDFLVRGGKAYEPLANISGNLVQYVKRISSRMILLMHHAHYRAGAQVQLPTEGAFLKNATSFDNISLGISTKDARVFPSSARRLSDLSFKALLDSGIDYRRRTIGCFMCGNIGLMEEVSTLLDSSNRSTLLIQTI
jgi:hypothetical protein